MARPWRIQFPDAVYHISARGNRRMDIFLDQQDRATFLQLLGEAARRFHVQIFAFCLMTNHYHLFLRTRKANLAASLHWLNAVYTMRFNRRHRLTGHLFQGRYQSVLVTEEAHWLHLSFYIHYNPVRAGLAGDPAAYPWSSFRDYIEPRPRYPWLDPGPILAAYGDGAKARRHYHRESLMLSGKALPFGDDFRGVVIWGSRETVKKMITAHRPSGQVQTVPDFRRSLKRETDLDREVAKVAAAFQVAPGELKRKRRNFPPRSALFYHLVENCGFSISQTAVAMGVQVSSASMAVRRGQELMQRSRSIRKIVEQLNFI